MDTSGSLSNLSKRYFHPKAHTDTTTCTYPHLQTEENDGARSPGKDIVDAAGGTKDHCKSGESHGSIVTGGSDFVSAKDDGDEFNKHKDTGPNKEFFLSATTVTRPAAGQCKITWVMRSLELDAHDSLNCSKEPAGSFSEKDVN